MTQFRAPIQLTVAWLVSALALVTLVVWAQHLGHRHHVDETVAAAQQRHAQATANRLAGSLRLAFALGDRELARDLATQAVQGEPTLRRANLRFTRGEPISVGEGADDPVIATATVEHHTASADMLIFGDWPLQQIPGTGTSLGEVEVETIDPGLIADRRSSPIPTQPLFFVALVATLGFVVASAWFVRRRLLALAHVAIDVATGQFERAHERAQRLTGADEFAWVGHQIHDIRDYTREQVERVHDRNALLLRDVTLQDERIARMGRLAAALVAPISDDPTLAPVLSAIMAETDAAMGLLLDQAADGRWHCLAARGLRVPLEDVDAGELALTLLPAEATSLGASSLPPLAANHPWLRSAERQIPLRGVAQIPLVFGRASLGHVILAAPEVFSDEDLGFFRDAAPPLAIALASRRAYAASQQLAAALELRNEELLTQRDELQVVDKLRQEFVANISHELRTPLNAIICYAEMMADGVYGETNAEQAKALAGIEQAGAHLLELVNQVLDLSRMDAGGISLNIEPCELRDVLGEAVTIATPLCRDRPYVPAFIGPSHQVHTDAERVYQIVTNLLNNAIKFTPTGAVTVELVPLADGGARIDVSDTGIGIASQDLDLIFEEFRQADGSSTRVHDGAGLGLHISRRLANALGGSLSVASTIGQGSVFTLHLPARTPEHQPQDTTSIDNETATPLAS